MAYAAASRARTVRTYLNTYAAAQRRLPRALSAAANLPQFAANLFAQIAARLMRRAATVGNAAHNALLKLQYACCNTARIIRCVY